jgi:ABC-type nickel/cobalt efflux system permease component RcnA
MWPLALFLLLATAAGIWLWQAWPQVLLQSAVWQRALNLELSRLLKAVANLSGGIIAAGVQFYLRCAARPGAWAWQDRDYHLAGNASGKT